jgi:hypothetical protein
LHVAGTTYNLVDIVPTTITRRHGKRNRKGTDANRKTC